MKLTKEESLARNPRLPELDAYYPPCGSCAFCGFWDKRHRLWDSFIELYDDCVRDGGSPQQAIDAICEHFPNENRAHIEKVVELRPYVGALF